MKKNSVRQGNKKMMSNEEYKRLVIEKHGDKYDLSETVYSGMKNNVVATCPEHGDFKVNAYNFVHICGCPKCGIIQRALNAKKREEFKHEKMTTERFIKEAKEIHGNKYDYSKTDLKKKDDKNRVCIICPVHGEFWQNPYSHLRGYGCEKCGKEKKAQTQTITTEEFIKRANAVHNNKYIYTDTVYKGCYEEVEIECPIHGKFKQLAYSHLDGHGCKKCATEANSKLLLSNTQDFIKKANEIHNGKENYELVEYKGAKIPITIVCEKGHIYRQIPNKHLSGHGCPYCINIISHQENEISEFIKSLGFEVETSNRKMLDAAKEIDIFIPSKNIAIEFDGLYWHNESKNKDKNYHLSKTEECEKKGIRLIHIFEDEWTYKQEIVKSRLKAILGVSDEKIYARKCEIKTVNNNDCKMFIETNHIQGNVGSSVKYGLYYNDELVSVMTFGKLRKNLGQESKENEYELLRFCNKLNTNVIGGASKLLKHFIKEHKPNSIVSYSDRRWNTGKVYEKMGFVYEHSSEPNYYYIIRQRRYNRFAFRKDILIKQGFDKNKSEHEIMLERGIYRIYDCGTKVYKMKLEY